MWHRVAGSTAALVLAATGLIATHTTAAAAVAPGSLITAGNTADLLESANATATSRQLTVTDNTSSSLGIATARAAAVRGPIVIRRTGETTSSVASRTRALNATEVVVIGATGGVADPAFLAGLESNGIALAYDIDVAHGPHAALEASRIDASGPRELVVALQTNASATAFGRALASDQGADFIAWQPGLDGQPLRDVLTNEAQSTITLIGEVSEFPYEDLPDEEMTRVIRIPTDDLTEAQTWAARARQVEGRNIGHVFAAPSDKPEAVSLAGRLAAENNGMAIAVGTVANPAAGGATGYLRLLSPAVGQVTLVGPGMKQAGVDALTARFSTPTSTGNFRIIRIEPSGNKYAITVRPMAGATSYEAYGLEGDRTTSSASSTLSVASAADAATIIAKSGSKEISRMEVRLNELSAETLGTSTVALTMRSTENVIRFTGASDRPRIITRTMTDPFNPAASAAQPAVMGITCTTEWVDNNMDRSKEYEYVIGDLTNVPAATCSPTAPVVPATTDGLVIARIDSPATVFPSNRASSNPTAANLSISDRFLAEATDSLPAKRAAGDDWSDLLLRWNAYISDSKVPGGYSGNPVRPLLMLHGDGHGANNANGSVRLRQDLRFRFGRDAGVSYSEHMGESVSYACSPIGTSCAVKDRATAPLSQLDGSGRATSTVSAVANLRASATLPLVKNAPPIDTAVSVSLRQGASVLRGYHDKMPQHEVYIGVPNSEWHRVYTSPYGGWYQLPCLFSSPSKPVPGCHVAMNLRL